VTTAGFGKMSRASDPSIAATSCTDRGTVHGFTSAGGCGAVLGIGTGEVLCTETAVRATTAVAAIALTVI
jgi:hypothetical protein